MCCNNVTGRQRSGSGQQQSEHLQQLLAQLAGRRQQPAQQESEQQWHYSQQYHFDPADSGSYPCRQQLHTAIWQDLAACHQAVADALAQQQHDVPAAHAAAPSAINPLLNPFGWVPQDPETSGYEAAGLVEEGVQQISSVRPKTAQIRSRTATSLPLECFDSPEMEQVDVQQQLQHSCEAGGPGLQAVSRFYSPDGAFSWKPCTVLQYDRCASPVQCGSSKGWIYVAM